jgi:hypothetical protein
MSTLSKHPLLTASASLFLLAAAALPAAAVKDANAPAGNAGVIQETLPHPSVIVFNQKGDGGSVKLTYAYLPKDGYAVVFGANENGAMSGKTLGTTELKAGDHRDVSIKLESAPKKGEHLAVGLYLEGNGDKTFDKSDHAVWQVSEIPAANMFMID